MGYLYLLHFSQPVGHARHYLGYSYSLRQRLDAHASGYGSAITRSLIAAGGTFEVVWYLPYATRADEIRYKIRKDSNNGVCSQSPSGKRRGLRKSGALGCKHCLASGVAKHRASCYPTNPRREGYIRRINKELRQKYSWQVAQYQQS